MIAVVTIATIAIVKGSPRAGNARAKAAAVAIAVAAIAVQQDTQNSQVATNAAVGPKTVSI